MSEDKRKCPSPKCPGEMVVRGKRRKSKDGTLAVDLLWVCPRCGHEEWHRLAPPYRKTG